MAQPAITELIPHRPPMLLIDEVVSFDDPIVVCRSTIRSDMPMVEDGKMAALVAIELFAQSAATLVSLKMGGKAAGMQSGALLGSRQLDLHTDYLHVGDVLTIRCDQKLALGPAAQVACELYRGEALLAEGTVNVMAALSEEAR